MPQPLEADLLPYREGLGGTPNCTAPSAQKNHRQRLTSVLGKARFWGLRDGQGHGVPSESLAQAGTLRPAVCTAQALQPSRRPVRWYHTREESG